MSENEKNLPSTWVDPDDAPELTEDFFKNATPKIHDVPVSKEEFVAAAKAKIGRPLKQDPKISVTIRLSQEVVGYFRTTGDGWQTRIDMALKEWLQEHHL